MNWVETFTLYFLSNKAKSSSILNGSVTKVLVPILITSTCSILDNCSNIYSNLALGNNNASPPVTNTSLMVGLCFIMFAVDYSLIGLWAFGLAYVLSNGLFVLQYSRFQDFVPSTHRTVML